jgi:hypothetical protein
MHGIIVEHLSKELIMEIKKGCKVSTSDFWYDLTDGGYLDPLKICAKKEDAHKVHMAIAIIQDFKSSCEENIPDFLQ